MDPIHVVVVERDADFPRWSSTSHLIGQALLVLVQQADESTSAFRARIQARLARLQQELASLVLLRGGRDGTGLSIDALVHGLSARCTPKQTSTYSEFFRHGIMGIAPA
jgi:hypothetical protein